MTIEEIKNRIEVVENAIFMQTMRDFIDWPRYIALKCELSDLRAELARKES